MKTLSLNCVRVVSIILLGSTTISTIGADSARSRQNLFDPIYAFDDIDAHTVSASSFGSSSGTTATTRQLSASAENKRAQPILQRPILVDNAEVPTLARFQIKSPSDLQQERARQAVNALSSPPGPLVIQTLSSTRDSSLPKAPKRDEQPQHWSALENYYQKLRQMSINPKQASIQPKDAFQLPLYQVLQQQETDDLLSAYKPLNSYPPYAGHQSVLSNTKNPSAFMLPLSSSLPESDPDYGFSVHRQSAPGISRTGGIGANSLLLNTNRDKYITPQQEQINVQNNRWFTRDNVPNVDSDGKVKYLEWRKLPELLLIQQQQQRVRHQQETFGSWYDHQRSKELLQEEAFCGPRNYVNFQVAPLHRAASMTDLQRIATKASQAQIQYDAAQLAKLQQLQLQKDAGLNTNQIDIPVTLSAGEYPSHMGVYNGTSPTEDNFLCAATWIHEQFALTLASCVNSANAKKLSVRAGEWNLDKNNTNDRTFTIREVEQVYLFPKYRNGSIEHNLAILKFNKPIEYLDLPYICPACQIQSRSSIRTSSCWTPVRNITLSEYFDAEGEGETKEKKNVNMIELPVRLIANDDTECYRDTRVEFFNFQHPNYICSSDYRTSPWRARLNQTDYFGSGIYCNEGGNLSLVSILHPIVSNSSSTYGYMDLSYYKPWMRNIISGRSF